MTATEARTVRREAAAQFRVLTICTGNLCRSPLAELLLAANLPGAAGLAPQHLAVVSAGTHARAGDAIDPEAADAALALGLDGSLHRARRLSADDVRAADLVVGLAREHRSAAVRLAPSAVRRCFTLLELARILDWMTERGWEHRQLEGDGGALAPLRAVVAGAGVQRGLVPPVADPDELDIRDPYRRGAAAHRSAAAEIASAVEGIGRSISGLVGRRPIPSAHGA